MKGPKNKMIAETSQRTGPVMKAKGGKAKKMKYGGMAKKKGSSCK